MSAQSCSVTKQNCGEGLGWCQCKNRRSTYNMNPFMCTKNVHNCIAGFTFYQKRRCDYVAINHIILFSLSSFARTGKCSGRKIRHRIGSITFGSKNVDRSIWVPMLKSKANRNRNANRVLQTANCNANCKFKCPCKRDIVGKLSHKTVKTRHNSRHGREPRGRVVQLRLLPLLLLAFATPLMQSLLGLHFKWDLSVWHSAFEHLGIGHSSIWRLSINGYMPFQVWDSA